MKKALSLVLIAIICIFTLSACGSNGGKTDNAKVIINNSTKFSNLEIQQAVDIVKEKFKTFKDCELKTLTYDENKSNKEIQSYLTYGKGLNNSAKAENVIILFSDFNTGPNAEGGFNTNSTYKWNWILIRESKTSSWILDDWGI
jgi:hypothetical protein